jgi:lipopolysaccharide export system permease protein
VKTFALILPAFLEVTVPMALLLAILLGFGRLASDSEIVALKTSGVSLYQMTRPVLVFMLLTSLATFAIAIWVRPWANGALREQLFEVVKSRVSAGFKEKVFNTDFPGLVLYIEEIEPGGNTLKGILISDSRNPQNRNTVIAKIGLLVPNEDAKTVTLRLLDGTIYGVGGQDNSFQKTDFTVYDVSLALTNFGEMRPREKDPKEMTLGELWNRIAERRTQHQPVNEEEIELQRKFSIPFACVVFTLVGVPLAIPPTRAVRSRGFSLSLGLIFLYYIPMTVGQTLAQKGFIPVAFGLWLPNVAFLVLGVLLFRAAARETPLRAAERLEVLRVRARSVLLEGLRQMGAS